MTSLAVAGSVIEVALPGDIAYAKQQASLADAARVLAETAAGVATTVAQGRYYGSYAAGNAATTAGQYFAVFTGGNYSFHVNGNATPVFVMPKVDTSGNMTLVSAQFPMIIYERTSVGTWSTGYSGTSGDNSWTLRVNGTLVLGALPSGNVGIGVAVPAARLHVKSTVEIMRLETTTARGGGNGFIGIYDPTGLKSVVGHAASDDRLQLVNYMNAALRLGMNASELWEINGSRLMPLADNGYALGGPSNRPNTIYAATGSINTSDGREKTAKRAFTAPELAAAKRIAAEIGIFQFLDGVRDHVGVIAQEVWSIMADEGLIDPIVEGETPSSSYAFLCYDEWDATDSVAPVEAIDEELDGDGNVLVPARPAIPGQAGREAGNRLGIRPDQLSLFLIAAQEQRLAALEAAL